MCEALRSKFRVTNARVWIEGAKLPDRAVEIAFDSVISVAVTFQAVLSKGVEPGLRQTLPQRLLHISTQSHAVLSKIGFDERRLWEASWRWVWNSEFDGSFDEWLAQPFVEIFFGEPPIIALGISGRASIVNLAVPWVAFVAQPAVQEHVRMAIHWFGKALGADSAIYLPDTGWLAAEPAVESVQSGDDFDAAVASFLTNLRARGSFPNPPRSATTANKAKHNKSMCSAWPAYFDRWQL